MRYFLVHYLWSIYENISYAINVTIECVQIENKEEIKGIQTILLNRKVLSEIKYYILPDEQLNRLN